MPVAATPQDAPPLTVHGTCVAVAGRAALITGASGTGKSSLALQLMAFGARLVSDDQTLLARRGPQVIATAPAPLVGLIEARGIGLLRADALAEAPLVVVVCLDQVERDRLPYAHYAEFCGQEFPCLHKVDSACFPAAIMQYLKAGRRDPE